MDPNIGWLFYKDFYNNLLRDSVASEGKEKFQPPLTGIDWNFLKKTNEDKKEKRPTVQEKNAFFLKKKTSRIENSKFTDIDKAVRDLLDLAASQHFQLTTTYPGLLTGSGYQHESHAQGEYKLGFFLDHTTGLPVIPGSSVKGVLRSIFEHKDGEYDNRILLIGILAEAGLCDIKVNADASRAEIARQLSDPKYMKLATELKNEIFNGLNPDGSPKNIYKRDTFYDAFIVRCSANGKFLASDFITPHKHMGGNHKLDPFSNPTPIMFLKVLPEVQFRFQFALHDGLITAAEKLLLFERILRMRGIGAKTNVGYGQFS